MFVHAGISILFAVILWKVKQQHEIVASFTNEAVLYTEPVVSEEPPADVLSEEPIRPSKAPSRVEPPPETRPIVGDSVDSTQVDSIAPFCPQDFFVASPFTRYKMPLDSLSTDSSQLVPLSSMLTSFSFDSEMQKPTPGPYDPIQRQIDSYGRDGQQPLSIGRAVGEGAKYISELLQKKKAEKPVRFDFIPSDAEIAVFKVLWQHPQARDHEIYAALDTSIRLTATDLNTVLTRLTEKGIIKRKIVSPQNEFTFPVGKIEMSSKNRRNRVYEYESRVQPQELLVFLQAVLYENENKKNSKSENRDQFLQSLRRKILKVAGTGG